jgi:hypothetical protein
MNQKQMRTNVLPNHIYGVLLLVSSDLLKAGKSQKNKRNPTKWVMAQPRVELGTSVQSSYYINFTEGRCTLTRHRAISSLLYCW